MSDEMRVEKTSTGAIIYHPSLEVKRKALQYFSLPDPQREYFIYSGTDINRKPLFGKEHDVLYITSGFLRLNDPIIEQLRLKTIRKAPSDGDSIELTMNREPRSQLQRDCIQKMLETDSSKLTIELKPGTGKEQPYSTLIPTPRGYVSMGNLNIDDQVFGRDGKPTTIVDIFEQGEKDVYKITFEDNRVAMCGYEHLWNVKLNNHGDWITITTAECMDYINKGIDLYIPLCDPVEYPSNKVDTIKKKLDFILSLDPDHVNEIHMNEDGSDKRLMEEIALPILYSLGYSAYIEGNILYYSKPDSLKITGIEFSHREKCRCIMVDNDEHLYLTEDYIVTHNTFIALYVISKLGKKPLIIAPTTLLKNQWIENFTDLGVDTSDIATRIHDAPNKKVCVVTISAIENELRKDWERLMDTIQRSNFGIHITDEAHLHLKGVLKFDAICNIKRNFYLSATLGRSDEDEDDVLNRALSDADRFIGNKQYEEYQDEYINVYLQDIYYNASREICDEHFRYGKKGLISATYYRMLMDYRHGIPFYRNAIHMVKVAEKIKVQGKVLLLLPLLDAIEAIKEEMKKDPYFDQFSIASVDGSMPLPVRQQALENDIILSTTMSMGTGVDVSNLGAVVNFDQKSSLIILEQIVGRLRNRGFQTYYIDVCDHVKYARAFENWGMKRRRYMPYFPGVSPKMKMLPKIMC